MSIYRDEINSYITMQHKNSWIVKMYNYYSKKSILNIPKNVLTINQSLAIFPLSGFTSTFRNVKTKMTVTLEH